MKAKAVPGHVTSPTVRYSLYRKASPEHDVTQERSVRVPSGVTPMRGDSGTETETLGGGSAVVQTARSKAADGTVASSTVEVTESPAKVRSRHKLGQAAYMREYRARKKAGK